jgi:hypothetical protein
MKKKNSKKTVVRALRLLEYFQLSDKNSSDIFRYSYNIFALFKNSYVLIPLFFSESLKVFRGTMRFHGIRFEKHW